jgi:hypothetical protein
MEGEGRNGRVEGWKGRGVPKGQQDSVIHVIFPPLMFPPLTFPPLVLSPLALAHTFAFTIPFGRMMTINGNWSDRKILVCLYLLWHESN